MTDLSWLRREARLTRADAARLCGVSLRTWRRWENGAGRIPACVVELLRLLSGDVARLGWPGWIMRDGQLWAPEDPAGRRGRRPEDLRRYWWDWQRLRALEQRVSADACGVASPSPSPRGRLSSTGTPS